MSEGRLESVRLGIVILLLCLGLGAIETAQVRLGGGEVVEASWWVAFWRVVPSWVLLAALSPLVVFATDRWPIRGPGWSKALSLHLLLSIPFAALHLLLTAAWGMIRPASLELGLVYGFQWLVSRYMVYDILAYGALAGVIHAFRYRRESALLRSEASHLITDLEDARRRLKAGKLHPHFVFNTLNAISALAARGDRPEVVRTLGAFGDLLRASLDDRQDRLVSVHDEVELVESYISIQRARFGARLEVEWEINPEVLKYGVPGLVLQTLVENAINHAVARSAAGGRVSISASVRAGTVEMEVRDTGAEEAVGSPGFESPGLGLEALQARLRTHFGDQAHFGLEPRSGGGSCARVRMPAVVFSP